MKFRQRVIVGVEVEIVAATQQGLRRAKQVLAEYPDCQRVQGAGYRAKPRTRKRAQVLVLEPVQVK